VRIEPAELGGVPTEIITLAEGVLSCNRQRVLINLHSGAFLHGTRWSGHVESIPIAALGKLRRADLGVQQETNRLIERLAAIRTDLHYVDVATPMIDQGKVRGIFRADDLHMTAEGYRIWASMLRPLVLREAARPAPWCEATFQC
jgi:hypothetical protein